MISELQNLLNNKSDNLYVYTKMIVRENSEFSMNVNSTISSEILTNIIYFINKLNTKNVILVCRSSNEPFADEHPAQTHLDLIKNQTDKNIIIFYQDPWPEPVPSFIEMDTTVIRFGFDEGCELDKKCIDPTFSIAMEDGEYNFLVNKNNSINLNNKKSII